MNYQEFERISHKWLGRKCDLADLLGISFGELLEYECGAKTIPEDIAEKIRKMPPPEEVKPKVTVKWYQWPIWETIGEILQVLCFILFFIPLAIVSVGCLFCGSSRR